MLVYIGLYALSQSYSHEASYLDADQIREST